MCKYFIVNILAIFFIPIQSFSQTVRLDSSNLPICIINTRGKTIANDPKILAHMAMIYNGPGKMNYSNSKNYNYNNFIAIEIRGNSSQFYPQKQYGLELRDSISGDDLDAELLGLPAEEDWVLYAPYNDISMLRNVLTYHVWNMMGHWGPRTKFCELILNNEYQGIYILTESIKRGLDRVDIAKMNPNDTSGLDLTGGYIMKIDKKNDPEDKSFISKVKSTNNQDVNWLYHYPKPEDLHIKQQDYIKRYIDTVEQLIASAGFADPINGYSKYLSIQSFIDYFLLTELTRNIDAYKASSFFHKEKQSKEGDKGKFKAGPVWDYNFAYGNASFCSGAQTTGWMYDGCVPATLPTPILWKRLLGDPIYLNEVKCRWIELRKTILDTGYLFSYLNKYAFDTLDAAQKRHFTKWRILGTNPGGFNAYIASSYPDEMNRLKTWIQNRLAWMDVNLQGSCIAAQAKIKSPLDLSCFTGTRPTITYVQPFEVYPFLYAGRESIKTIPNNIIRWVLVELRSSKDSSIIVDRRAALLRNDSTILDTNFQTTLQFSNAKANEDYFLSIRYDLGGVILSKNKIRLPNNLNIQLNLPAQLRTPHYASSIFYDYNIYGIDTIEFCEGDEAILSDSNLLKLGYSNLDFEVDDSRINVVRTGTTQFKIFAPAPGFYHLNIFRSCAGEFGLRSSIYLNVLPKMIPLITGEKAFCIGDSIQLEVQEFVKYNWSNGATVRSMFVNEAGTYAVTVTEANGCISSSTIMVEQFPEILGDLQVETKYKPDTCLVQFIPKDSNQILSYLWNDGSRGSKLESIFGLIALTVKDTNGCEKNFETSCIPSSNLDLEDYSEVILFPNPSDGKIYIQSTWPISSLVFTSVTASVLRTLEFQKKDKLNLSIDLTHEATGLYLFYIYGEQGERCVKKLLLR